MFACSKAETKIYVSENSGHNTDIIADKTSKSVGIYANLCYLDSLRKYDSIYKTDSLFKNQITQIQITKDGIFAYVLNDIEENQINTNYFSVDFISDTTLMLTEKSVRNKRVFNKLQFFEVDTKQINYDLAVTRMRNMWFSNTYHLTLQGNVINVVFDVLGSISGYNNWTHYALGCDLLSGNDYLYLCRKQRDKVIDYQYFIMEKYDTEYYFYETEWDDID